MQSYINKKYMHMNTCTYVYVWIYTCIYIINSYPQMIEMMRSSNRYRLRTLYNPILRYLCMDMSLASIESYIQILIYIHIYENL